MLSSSFLSLRQCPCPNALSSADWEEVGEGLHTSWIRVEQISNR